MRNLELSQEKKSIVSIVERKLKVNGLPLPISGEKASTGYIEKDTPIENRPTIQTKEDLREMYPEYFTNSKENQFPNYNHITLNPEANKKIHAPQRQTLELQELIKEELARMERRRAITKVNEPMDWVNSMNVTTRTTVLNKFVWMQLN